MGLVGLRINLALPFTKGIGEHPMAMSLGALGKFSGVAAQPQATEGQCQPDIDLMAVLSPKLISPKDSGEASGAHSHRLGAMQHDSLMAGSVFCLSYLLLRSRQSSHLDHCHSVKYYLIALSS